jgi:acetylornithine deacetylase/succinyl-diaminopimelate desuccinylase-like protein
VMFGSGELDSAHSDHESVDVDQVLLGTSILVDFLAAREAGTNGTGHAHA